MAIDPNMITAGQQQGNFINPAYATPDQQASMRDYANALISNSQKMPVRNGWQGLAQMANSAIGGLYAGKADALQRQLMQQGSDDTQKGIGMLPGFNGGGGTASDGGTNVAGNQDIIGALGQNIAGIESGGNYGAIGPQTAAGDRAYGKYQVMGSNIPSWTKELLGKSYSSQDFLADPQAQEAVFRGKMGQYVQQTGNVKDAASMWFTGRPLSQAANASDVNGMTGARYADIATRNLPGSQPGPTQVASNGSSDAPQGTAPTTGAGSQGPLVIDPKTNRDNYGGIGGVRIDTTGGKNVPVHSDTGVPFTDQEVAASQRAPTQAPIDTVKAYAPAGAPTSGPAAAAIGGATAGAPATPSSQLPPEAASHTVALANSGQQAPTGQPQTSGVPRLDPQQIAQILSDPTASPAIKEALMHYITPTTVEGPMGTSYYGSPYSMLSGQSTTPYANKGLVTTMKINGMEVPAISVLGPDGKYSVTPLTPGSTGSFNPQGIPGQNHPASSTQGSTAAATGTTVAPGNATNTSPTTSNGLKPPPFPMGGSLDDLQAYQAKMKAYQDQLDSQKKTDSETYNSNNTALNSTQNQLNDLKVYRGILTNLKNSGNQNYLGTLSDHAKEMMSLANSFGLAPKNVQEALAGLEGLGKTSNKLLTDTLGSVPGISGHTTNMMMSAINSMTPSAQLSYLGNKDFVDILTRATEMKQIFQQKMNQFYHEHNNSLTDTDTGMNFNDEWIKAVQGKGSSDPALQDVKPFVLGKIDQGRGVHTDPKTGKQTPVVKVPDTSERGFQVMPADQFENEQ